MEGVAVVSVICIVFNAVAAKGSGCEMTQIGDDAVRVRCFGVDIIPSDLPSNTTELILANNAITVVSNLTHLGNLRLLDLSHNRIAQVSANDFQSLSELIHLDLSYNRLTFDGFDIASGSFNGTPRLRILKVLTAPPVGLPVSSLVELSHLEELHASLTDDDALPQELNHLIHIQRIFFIQSLITHLTYSMLSPLRSLPVKEIYLQSTSATIEYIQDGTFANFPHLKSLVFTCSHLKDGLHTLTRGLQTLGSTPLEDLVADNVMYESENTVVSLYTSDFCNQLGNKLIRLSLRSVKISHIFTPVIRCFKKIQIFNFGHGNFPYIWTPAPDFTNFYDLTDYIPNVRVLDISHIFSVGPASCFNQVEAVDYYFESDFCGDLEHIDLPNDLDTDTSLVAPTSNDRANTKLYIFPPKLECFIANNFPSLLFYTHSPDSNELAETKIWADPNNRLKTIDLSQSSLQTASIVKIKGLHHLQKLNLAHCKIGFLIEDVYNCLPFPQLVYLNLSHTDLNGRGNAFRYSFICLPHLQTLDLGGNGIKHIHPNAFENLSSLQVLQLNDNELESDIWFKLTHLTSLKHISLEHNQLLQLHPRMTSQLDQLNYNTSFSLALSDNPLVCNCETRDFLHWFLSTSVRIVDKEHLVCSLSNRSVTILDVNLADMTESCRNKEEEYLRVALLSCTSLLVVGSALVAVFVHWRWHIQWYFYILRIKFRSKSSVDGKTQHLHDLFIVTSQQSQEDCHFIAQKFLPCLHEQTPAIRTFTLGVDDLPGDLRADIIVDAVDQTRRTLLLITPDFIKDPWCDFAVQMALVKGVERLMILHVGLTEENAASMNKTLRKLMSRSSQAPLFEWPSGDLPQHVIVQEMLGILQPVQFQLSCIQGQN